MSAEVLSLVAEGWLLQYGDPLRSRQLGESALALAKQQDDPCGAAYARLVLACFDMRHGDPVRAEAEFIDLKARFESDADLRGMMRAGFGCSVMQSRSGNTDSAYAELIRFVPELDGAELVDAFLIRNALGATCSDAGLPEEAMRHFYKALAAARQLGSPDHLALVLSNLGDVQHGAGNYEDAIRFLVEASEMVARSERAALATLVASNLAMCQLAIGAHEAAFDTIHPHLHIEDDHLRMGRANAAFFQAIAAHTYAAHGEWDQARALIVPALAAAAASEEPGVTVHCHWVQGLIAHGESRPADALLALQEAERLLGKLQDPYYPVQISRELARTHAALGNWQTAYAYQEQHQQLYQRSTGSAARAKALISNLQNELAEAERERDFALHKHAEAERARAELEKLNHALAGKMQEIERLQAKLREQAVRDPLTNLYNRRYLQEELSNQIRLAGRRRYPLCVVLIDLDHFKSVNDRFGHPAGDQVLVDFAAMLAMHIRGSDFACRFGGEEFCLVLSDIRMEQALVRMHALLDAMRALIVQGPDFRIDQLTFSAGLAEFPRCGTEPDLLLHAADGALYLAKQSGRNQVLVATTDC
ncbi:diguanylate cyclase [Chitinimonas sp. BJYL2]|uniref:diguanylate cyclase n=1 Tax=Chitinimonas sp. BJYL2 TaxID=2976696 RepID=UPI0022B58235|nr:diguanylate cyclase [Chitinimonas sp. BJYL2]